MSIRLHRKVFETSRLTEFCSVNELEKQTGHPVDQWLLVLLKELVDNALDEAEKANIPPVIEIMLGDGEITVTDNGPGIAASTVEKILDFNVRVSDKEAYVSPTRGAQGNALKTIIAMPYVLDGKRGETVIEAHGIRHSIIFETEPIRREPKIRHEQTSGRVQNGNRITVRWPVSPSSQLIGAKARFVQIGIRFLLANPHLTMRLTWDGERCIDISATDPTWTKWSPADPIPAHWYTPDRFERLIAAHIAHDQDHGGAMTVREFVGEFRGLARTDKQKQLLAEVGASRQSLAEFYDEGRNHKGIARLLSAMKDLSCPVKPRDLGAIGRDHIEHCFKAVGADIETLVCPPPKYGTTDGLPWVVETAFAIWSRTCQPSAA